MHEAIFDMIQPVWTCALSPHVIHESARCSLETSEFFGFWTCINGDSIVYFASCERISYLAIYQESGQCVQFIEIYGNFAFLWKTKEKYYHNRNKKEDAWKQIGKFI